MHRVLTEHLCKLNSVLGPKNVSVNKMKKFSAFLNGASIQMGHMTNKKINMKQMQGVMSVMKKN